MLTYSNAYCELVKLNGLVSAVNLFVGQEGALQDLTNLWMGKVVGLGSGDSLQLLLFSGVLVFTEMCFAGYCVFNLCTYLSIYLIYFVFGCYV